MNGPRVHISYLEPFECWDGIALNHDSDVAHLIYDEHKIGRR